MADIKLTKNELRAQQTRLSQLQKYLPTLQLKKAMLQLEVSEAKLTIEELKANYQRLFARVDNFASLLSENFWIDPEEFVKVEKVNKTFENIAGVEVPIFQGVQFFAFQYSLFETPPWIDSAVDDLKKLVTVEQHIEVMNEKKAALEAELREVSIRVNLFEKVLIPRAVSNIKNIKVFLGDQQLAAVSQAKVAKTKIIEKKKLKFEDVLFHAN